MNIKTYYKRRLPHIHPIGATFFITFRLANSLSNNIIQKLKIQYQDASYEEQKLYFKAFDQALDRSKNGNHYLKNPTYAEIVATEIRKHDQELYDLVAYCIMSNHVHLLIDTSIQLKDGFADKSYRSVPAIMHLIKGASARRINKLLGKSGTFWQEESYDHFVRDEKEFRRIVTYILENPVKAGIVKNWQAYPYSYVQAGFIPQKKDKQKKNEK